MTSMPAAPDAAQNSRTEGAVEFAYGRVRRAILVGELAPGEILSQVRLAAEFGISRTPLREALNRLEVDGLITSDFNRRVRVSELDLDDVDQIYAIRMSLEPIGIRVTVGNCGDDEKLSLATSVALMDQAIETADMDAFREHHRQFHLGLTSHAGARIVRLLADLWDHSERYRLAYLHYDGINHDAAQIERLRTSQTEHTAILNAALAGDAERCASLEVAHLNRTLQGVFTDASQAPQPRASRGVRPL